MGAQIMVNGALLPREAPVACLSAVAQRVPDGTFLVAADEGPDGQGFCGVVMRARLRGLVDWNAWSRAVP
jgi:hypothetical protein